MSLRVRRVISRERDPLPVVRFNNRRTGSLSNPTTGSKSIVTNRRTSARSKRMRRLANNVQRYLGEKKYSASYTNVSVSSAGNVFGLTEVTQGDTDQTRDGDQLTLTSLQLRWQAIIGDTANYVRVIVFQWLANSVPTINSVLLSLPLGGEVLSPYNHDTRYVFRVLYDKTVLLTNVGKPSSEVYDVRLIKFPRNRVQYEAGGTTGTNKIYCITLSDSGAVSHPAVNMYWKTNFKDS